jgi:regulator of cell morphogenesis and NO signaling
MSQQLEQRTVGQLVTEQPKRARVFEKFGIDYCCGGQQPLAEACRRKNLDLAHVLAALAEADQAADTAQIDWQAEPMGRLADHITQYYHGRLRQELPRLDFLTNKVAAVHGPNHPELRKLREVFVEFKQELELHMHAEEQVLFPQIKRLEAGAAPAGSAGGEINTPIAHLVKEHDDAGVAMEVMRRLTGGYAAPADACNTYRAMLDGLAELETEMHRHVHAENSILFPRAMAAEAGGGAARAR